MFLEKASGNPMPQTETHRIDPRKPAGTVASTHEDAYVDSGTSPPTSEHLPKGYVQWVTDNHIAPTAYKNWFSDWLSYLSQENLKIDLIRLPRILATLQSFPDHPELHSTLSKCRVPTLPRDSSAVAVSELRRAITPAKCFRTARVSLRRSYGTTAYRL